MIKTILWDIDGTILNFQAAEREAIRKCFAAFGLGPCTDEMIGRYSVLNLSYWKRLERGEITKPALLRERFVEFFASEGVVCGDPDGFNAAYQICLGDTICFNDEAYDLVKSLQGKVRQYAVTNGTKVAQVRKLSQSGLDQIFDGVFISDEVGYEKPSVEFFDYVLARMEPCEKSEMIIVGDSLTSDIRGGNNAGIPTVWYNPEALPNDKGVSVDYEIRDLRELLGILESARD